MCYSCLTCFCFTGITFNVVFIDFMLAEILDKTLLNYQRVAFSIISILSSEKATALIHISLAVISVTLITLSDICVNNRSVFRSDLETLDYAHYFCSLSVVAINMKVGYMTS